VFIKYEAEVSSRVGGSERGVGVNVNGVNVNNGIRNLACIGLVAYRNNDLFTLINMIEVFVKCLII